MSYPKKYNEPDRWCYIAVEVAAIVVGTAASIAATQAGADAQENQFKQQQLQLRLQEVDAQSKRTDQLRRIFGEQAVQEIARGISLASPSFQAVQQQSFNAFNDDNRAASLSLSFKENALNSAIDATREGANIKSVGIFAQGVSDVAGTFNLNSPNNQTASQQFKA